MPYGKILIIDEDAGLRRLISDYLAKNGMESFTTSRVDGLTVEAARYAEVIVLSRGAAEEGTGEAVSQLRGGRGIPIIVIASEAESGDIAELLRQGADNVITRPFDIAELSLKIKALLRRREETEQEAPTSCEYRGLKVDIAAYRVTADGTDVMLSPKEIELLFLLMSRREQVFGRSELSSRVWGRVLSDNRTIAVHINRIKKKIGRYAENIAAVRGVGYRFTEMNGGG